MTLPTGKLGANGPIVSRIGLGCMSLTKGFYGQASAPTEEEGTAVLRRAVELGVTLLNTADLYGPFVNHLLIG
jgi:aryl-alcohol dehydrogenase-like predicted oxidoreductase